MWTLLREQPARELGRERVRWEGGGGRRCSPRKAEAEMVGWHHRLNGHESEQTLGDREGQGSLACCSP